jgi:predicted nucleic acid-binding Zn ribbon protein
MIHGHTGDATGDATQGEVIPAKPAPAESRSGLEIAREALAAAKADAKRRAAARPAAGRQARPADERRSSAGADGRDPQPLAGSIQRLVEGRGWSANVAVGGVIGRWEELVGAELAAHCVPESFAEGELVVRADSSAWATQVRWIAQRILARINEELGTATVTALRVLGPDRPSWRKGAISVRGRGPRDTYG